MQTTKRNLMALVIAATCLTGCGNRLPANAPIDEATADAAATAPAATTPAPAAAAPAAAAPAPMTPAYTQPVAGSLVVSNVEKTKKGIIFFKHMLVKGSVLNTSSVPLSGNLKIEFKVKKGIINKSVVTSETKLVAIANLAPGSSYPFDVTSEKSGIDDAEVTVEASPTQAAAPAASAYPTGAATGSPYGAAAATTQPGMGAYGY